MKGALGNLFIIPVLLAALNAGKGLFSIGSAGYASSTPGIPSSGHGRRSRAKASNDGRWHMKYHRSRG